MIRDRILRNTFVITVVVIAIAIQLSITFAIMVWIVGAIFTVFDVIAIVNSQSTEGE